MHSYKDIRPLRVAMLKFKGPPAPPNDKWKRILESYHLTKESCFVWEWKRWKFFTLPEVTCTLTHWNYYIFEKVEIGAKKIFPTEFCMSFLESQKKVVIMVTEILNLFIVISGICVQYAPYGQRVTWNIDHIKNNSYILSWALTVWPWITDTLAGPGR